MTLIGQSTTIAKDVLPGGDKESWTPEKRDEFSVFLSQTVLAWRNITAEAAVDLFDGSPENIDRLYAAISDGKLIDGKKEGESHPWETDPQVNRMLANSIKTIVGFALPALWRRSGSYTFIMDAGHACNEGTDLSDYLSSAAMDATGVCVDDQQYYLVYPDGEASECSCIPNTGGNCQPVCTDNRFSAPAGIEHLSNGNSYSDVTTNELVRGSVRTWIANGRENGAKLADPTNGGTLSDLVDLDVTTPGFMRIPVCSPERAFQDECEHSSFVDQTSSASPKVEDCRQIIRNIEGDGSTAWTTQVVGHPHREIARAGSCSFGVEATKTDGNVNFVVGGQDVIDIINGAISRFERDGRVGAKGEVNCNGNDKSQPILWGIY